MKKKKSEGKKSEKKKDEKMNVYLCPKCRSPNVFKVRNFGTLWGLISKWKCNSCGFEEKVFPFVDGKFSKGKKSSGVGKKVDRGGVGKRVSGWGGKGVGRGGKKKK